MPHLTGIFDEFPEIDKVSPQELQRWLKQKPEIHFLVNYFGNRVIYPQTIPLNKTELEIDLAILREGIKQRPMLVYDPQRAKLYIPQMFVQRFPPLSRLAGVIVEAISPKGVNEIYIKNKNQIKLIGTVISPVDINKVAGDKPEIKVLVDGVENVLRVNTLSIAQIVAPEIQIKIGSNEYKVNGGELGVILDLRVGEAK